jgi:hypothetical protein
VKKNVIRVKIQSPYQIIGQALEYAAARACNRCDKYNELSLSESQRASLIGEFETSFWLALDDAGVEVK